MSFINDVRLIFSNVYLFYTVSDASVFEKISNIESETKFGTHSKLFQEDSKVYGHSRYLEQFFEQQLLKWLPQYTTSSPAGVEESFTNAAKRSRADDDVEMIS